MTTGVVGRKLSHPSGTMLRMNPKPVLQRAISPHNNQASSRVSDRCTVLSRSLKLVCRGSRGHAASPRGSARARNLHMVTQPEGHRARAESHPPEPTNSPLSLLVETRTRKGSMGDKPHFRSMTLPFERDLENQPHRGISISFPVCRKQ